VEKQQCPEVRFKGYDQKWRLKKLEEIGIFNPYSNLPQVFEYVDLESVVGTELINSRKETIETAPSRAQRLAYRGDVFYQAVRPYQKNNYLFALPYDNYVFSTGYIQIRPTINSYYLLSFVQKNDFVQKVLENCTGTSYPAINTTGLKSIDVFISSEANEQTAIGNFFQNLDQSIALHEKKLAQTQNLKKAMLEKMFPKAGSKQPEIRLKGFSGAWELKSLSNVSERFEYGLNAQATTFDGINKYIRITDIDDESRKFILDDITSPNICFDNCEKYKLSTGDILFARTGASVGKTYIYLEEDGLVYFAGFLIRAKIKDTFDANFIFTNTLTERFNKFVQLTSQRSGQPGINAKEYGEYEFYCPNKDEQESIGRFFKQLDETLVLQQQQLQTLKNLKQAFLEKMFV